MKKLRNFSQMTIVLKSIRKEVIILFENIPSYPRTDLSELNLDWLIRLFKQLEGRFDEIEKRFNSIEILTPEEIKREIQKAIAVYNETVLQLVELKFDEAYLKSKGYTDIEISRIKVLIDVKIDECLKKSKEYTDEVKEFLEGEIDDKIVNYLYMINPITGENEEIPAVINDIVNTFHKTGALTVEEFDALKLTVEKFDAYSISAFNLDFHGKEILKNE